MKRPAGLRTTPAPTPDAGPASTIPYTALVPPDRPGDAGPEATPGGPRPRAGSRSSGERQSGGPKRPPRPDLEATNGSGRRPRAAVPGDKPPARKASGKKAGAKKPPAKKARTGAPSSRAGGQARAAGPGRPSRAPGSDPVTRSTGPLASTAVAATEPTVDVLSPAAPVDFAPVPAPQVARRGAADSPAPATAPTPVATAPTTTAPAPRPGVRHGRRVKRVVRRVELWSVLKLCLVLYTCLYLAVLATLAVVWGLAYSSGQIENLQEFLGQVGLDNYRFYGDQMFRAAAAIGAIGVLAGTILTVLTAALVNLISEMTGGIRVVVIEEDVTPGPRTR